MPGGGPLNRRPTSGVGGGVFVVADGRNAGRAPSGGVGSAGSVSDSGGPKVGALASSETDARSSRSDRVCCPGASSRRRTSSSLAVGRAGGGARARRGVQQLRESRIDPGATTFGEGQSRLPARGEDHLVEDHRDREHVRRHRGRERGLLLGSEVLGGHSERRELGGVEADEPHEGEVADLDLLALVHEHAARDEVVVDHVLLVGALDALDDLAQEGDGAPRGNRSDLEDLAQALARRVLAEQQMVILELAQVVALEDRGRVDLAQILEPLDESRETFRLRGERRLDHARGARAVALRVVDAEQDPHSARAEDLLDLELGGGHAQAVIAEHGLLVAGERVGPLAAAQVGLRQVEVRGGHRRVEVDRAVEQADRLVVVASHELGRGELEHDLGVVGERGVDGEELAGGVPVEILERHGVAVRRFFFRCAALQWPAVLGHRRCFGARALLERAEQRVERLDDGVDEGTPLGAERDQVVGDRQLSSDRELEVLEAADALGEHLALQVRAGLRLELGREACAARRDLLREAVRVGVRDAEQHLADGWNRGELLDEVVQDALTEKVAALEHAHERRGFAEPGAERVQQVRAGVARLHVHRARGEDGVRVRHRLVQQVLVQVVEGEDLVAALEHGVAVERGVRKVARLADTGQAARELRGLGRGEAREPCTACQRHA